MENEIKTTLKIIKSKKYNKINNTINIIILYHNLILLQQTIRWK